MSSKLFGQWFKEYLKIYPLHVASGDVDRMIADKAMQASIRKSRTDMACYLFLEAKITTDYARLIDTKLREAFGRLDLIDFKDPSGFAQLKLASPQLKDYLNLRNQFESFIQRDIFQHTHEDSRLNAFRRWVDVAAHLFSTGCYEGYHLVIVKLQQLENPALVDGLTARQQKKYSSLCRLSQSNGQLRAYIDEDSHPSRFKPVPLWSLSLSALMEQLGSDKHQPLSFFSENSPNYMQAKKRDALYHEISCLLTTKPEPLPPHLEKTYEQVQANFAGSGLHQPLANARRQDVSTASKLYSTKGLLPSFWQRSCRGEYKAYEDMYATTKTDVVSSFSALN